MNPNQFIQTDNPVATFGENSQSVTDLQNQLNSQGANLQVDGLFGPLTQAAQNQFQGSSSGTPAGQPVLEPEVPVSSFVAPIGEGEENKISQSLLNTLRVQEERLNREPDEEQIRRDVLRQFQGQIDATNSIFADELERAQVTGRGRLGSQTAMSSRRGLLGSDFGEAQIQGQEDANEQVFQGIENARLAKIAFIQGEARTDASAAILAKNQAFSEGLDARLAFRNEADSRKATGISKAARLIISQGFDISELRDSELNQLAKFYGISADDIKNGFASEKSAFESEQAATAREGQFNLSEGQVRFDAEGNIIAQGNSKSSDETSSIKEYRLAQEQGFSGTFQEYNQKQSSGLTPYQQFSATQSISKDNAARTSGARELERQSGIIKATYDRYANGEAGDLNGTTQAIVTVFNKLLDPTSVVRESEYDRSSSGQALISTIQGKIAALSQGGPGLTQESLKELVDLGNIYSENAKRSIQSENQRAMSLAESFGLNSSFVTSPGFEQETQQTLIQRYQSSTPEQQSQIDLIITENPELGENEILQIMGFSSVVSDTNQAKRVANAIMQVESGGRQVSGASGEFGSFQFMPATWKIISKQVTGSVIEQTAENERAVAEAKIGQLLAAGNSPREVALIWNTSLGGAEKPFVRKGVNSKGVAFDSGGYANKVINELYS